MCTAPPFSAATWHAGKSVADPQSSPDGSQLSWVVSVNGASFLAVRASAGGGPERWLPLEPPVRSISPSGGGAHAWVDGGIVYVGSDGRVHRYDLATSTCRPLTRAAASTSTLSASSAAGIATFVQDVQEVASIALDGSSWPQRLSSGADFVLDAALSHDGSWVTWHEWDAPSMPWDGGRVVVRSADGNGPIATVAGGDEIAVQQPRFAPGGTQLAFLCDANGWMNLWIAEGPSFEEVRPLVDEPYEHGGPSWGPGQRTYAWVDGGRSIAFCRNRGGRGQLAVVDVATGEVRDLAWGTFTGLVAVGRRVAGIRSDVAAASALVLVDLVTGAIEEVVRGPVAGLERGAVEPEAVAWESADGTLVPGRLYRSPAPRTNGLPPMLVWVHPGPHGQSPATLYPRWQYFLDRGWSILVPDQRGSTGWGRAHLQGLRGGWGVVDVQDVAAGIQHAIDQGWADASRIVPIGTSAGGAAVLWLLAGEPDLCAAGVAVYPVTDIVAMNEETWRYEAHYMESLIGSLPDAYDEYVARSPIHQVDAMRAPVLLLHGDADEVVPVQQSRDLAASLQNRGVPVELHVYEGEGHGWRRPATSIDELERIESFLRRHVLHLAPGQ